MKVACMLVLNVHGKCKRECSSKPNVFLAIYDWSMHRHAHWLATPEHAPLRRTDRPGRFTGEPINVTHVVIFTLHNPASLIQLCLHTLVTCLVMSSSKKVQSNLKLGQSVSSKSKQSKPKETEVELKKSPRLNKSPSKRSSDRGIMKTFFK